MTQQEQEEFVEQCFRSLIERKVIKDSDIKKSTITESDIKKIEDKYNIKFPSLFKVFIMSYHYCFTTLKECIFSYSEEYHKEQWVMITPLPEVGTFETLEGWFNDDGEIDDKEGFIKRGYIPFGDWGYGWGPMCLKTSGADNEEDCEIVWFDHEEYYNFEDVSECESQAMSSFKEFLECYFMAKYDEYRDYEDEDDEDEDETVE